MIYALTFTTDTNDGWGTTDTIIFETPSQIATFTQQKLEDLVYKVLKDYSVEGAEIIATGGWWYIRNCDDIDVREEL